MRVCVCGTALVFNYFDLEIIFHFLFAFDIVELLIFIKLYGFGFCQSTSPVSHICVRRPPFLSLYLLSYGREHAKRFNFHVIFNHPFSCCSFANNFFLFFFASPYLSRFLMQKQREHEERKREKTSPVSFIFFLATRVVHVTYSFRKYIQYYLLQAIHVMIYCSMCINFNFKRPTLILGMHYGLCNRMHVCVCAATGVVCSLKPQN